MANPYYIQRRRNPLIDYAQLGLQLYGLKQRGEIAKGQQDVDKDRLALEETKTRAEYGTHELAGPTKGGGPLQTTSLAERRVGVAESATQLSEQKFTEEQRQFDAQNRYKVQWGKHMDEVPSEVNLIGLKNRVKVFEAPINRLLEGIEKGDIKTRWDAYHSLKPTEAVLIKESKDALEKEILGLKKKGKDGEAEELGQLYSQLRPGFLEKFFGFPPDMQPGTEGRATVTRPPTLKAPAKSIGLIEQEAAARARGVAGTKKLSDLKKQYSSEVKQYRSAKRGVGQFIEDPNKEQVASESLQTAENLAVEYVKKGGRPEDLGITAEGIRNDFLAKKITEKKAVRLLKELFGMK